jgi:hypothetical protein
LGDVYYFDGNDDWVYAGNPGSNDHVFSMAVWNHQLYAGTWGGQVFRYNGGTSWSWAGFSWDGYWVNALTVSNGRLYAGRVDGNVYVYNGGVSWTAVGDDCPVTDVGSMIHYNSHLYASDSWSGVMARYNGPYVDPPWSGVGCLECGVRRNSMAICQKRLYAGGADGYLYRYDFGTLWTDVGTPLGSGSGAMNAVVEFDKKIFAGGNFDFNGHVYCYTP